MQRMTAAQIMQLLNLRPHTTCGFVNETYASPLRLPGSALPAGYEGERALGNVLCFLVTRAAPVRLHRIRSDQMYHHYLGDPLEVLLLYPDGRSDVKLVGSELSAGQRPYLFLPGGTFHTARVAAAGEYALLATSVFLRAEPPDVEPGDAHRLAAQYPAAADGIRAFTAGH